MKRILAVGAAALACLAATTTVAASALAGQQDRRSDAAAARVLYDCATSRTGLLQHVYSVRVLRIAQHRISGDIAEYTGCNDAVRAAIRSSSGNVVASIRRSRRGGAVAGRIALLDLRGRAVDVIDVRRGERAHFRVIPGRYLVRANGRRSCTVKVRATSWRTASASVVCRRG
jgi:hypothetical protein